MKEKTKNKLYFFIFIFPAFLLYFIFFIIPLIQGIYFSFTDWNGIKPEIPIQINKKEFEENILNKIKNSKDKEYLKKYYKLNGDFYIINYDLNFLQKAKIKTIFNKINIKSINFIGIKNYIEIFKEDKRYRNYVIPFSIFFTIVNVILTNFFALILALFLDMKLKTKNILRTLFFMPNVLSLIIVAFIWSFIYTKVFEWIYSVTNIDIFNLGWLSGSNPKKPNELISILPQLSIIIVSVWQGVGYIMIIYLAGLQNIPLEILEVAQIDGANGIKRFLHITLPLLAPAATISIFLTITNSLRVFELPFALTQGGPGSITQSYVLDIYYDAFNKNLYGYGTAKAVILCIIIMIITSIQLTVMKKRELEY